MLSLQKKGGCFMSPELILKECILSKYKSIRAFSLSADIPYTTIANVLNRGIAKSGIETMLDICNTLEIDVEELYNNCKIVSRRNNLLELKKNAPTAKDAAEAIQTILTYRLNREPIDDEIESFGKFLPAIIDVIREK